MKAKIALALLFAVVWAAGAGADEKIEKYPDGQIKAKYVVTSEGKKQGTYAEFYASGRKKTKTYYKNGVREGAYREYYENGKKKVKTAYRGGQLHGKYKSYHENGKPQVTCKYRQGKLHGEYAEKDKNGDLLRGETWLNGVLICPKSREIIRAKLAEILTGVSPAARKKAARKAKKRKRRPVKIAEAPAVGGIEAAVRRLNAYRYLVDVPYDVKLDKELNSYARAAARICRKIGELDHRPPNPGMSEAKYRYAYHGTRHSNLHMGAGSVTRSVDGFMDDSDPSNIDRVGHRRWCINPSMARVGFGAAGRFVAMMAHDQSRQKVPDYDYICYPPRGYMPLRFFSKNHAWSVSLSAAKYREPVKSKVKVKVYPLKPAKKSKLPDLNKRGAALILNYFNVDTQSFALPYCIIFRPQPVGLYDGQQYWVEITGISKFDGTPAKIGYLVEFMRR